MSSEAEKDSYKVEGGEHQVADSLETVAGWFLKKMGKNNNKWFTDSSGSDCCLLTPAARMKKEAAASGVQSPGQVASPSSSLPNLVRHFSKNDVQKPGSSERSHPSDSPEASARQGDAHPHKKKAPPASEGSSDSEESARHGQPSRLEASRAKSSKEACSSRSNVSDVDTAKAGSRPRTRRAHKRKTSWEEKHLRWGDMASPWGVYDSVTSVLCDEDVCTRLSEGVSRDDSCTPLASRPPSWPYPAPRCLVCPPRKCLSCLSLGSVRTRVETAFLGPEAELELAGYSSSGSSLCELCPYTLPRYIATSSSEESCCHVACHDSGQRDHSKDARSAGHPQYPARSSHSALSVTANQSVSWLTPHGCHSSCTDLHAGGYRETGCALLRPGEDATPAFAISELCGQNASSPQVRYKVVDRKKLECRESPRTKCVSPTVSGLADTLLPVDNTHYLASGRSSKGAGIIAKCPNAQRDTDCLQLETGVIRQNTTRLEATADHRTLQQNTFASESGQAQVLCKPELRQKDVGEEDMSAARFRTKTGKHALGTADKLLVPGPVPLTEHVPQGLSMYRSKLVSKRLRFEADYEPNFSGHFLARTISALAENEYLENDRFRVHSSATGLHAFISSCTPTSLSGDGGRGCPYGMAMSPKRRESYDSVKALDSSNNFSLSTQTACDCSFPKYTCPMDNWNEKVEYFQKNTEKNADDMYLSYYSNLLLDVDMPSDLELEFCQNQQWI